MRLSTDTAKESSCLDLRLAYLLAGMRTCAHRFRQIRLHFNSDVPLFSLVCISAFRHAYVGTSIQTDKASFIFRDAQSARVFKKWADGRDVMNTKIHSVAV